MDESGAIQNELNYTLCMDVSLKSFSLACNKVQFCILMVLEKLPLLQSWCFFLCFFVHLFSEIGRACSMGPTAYAIICNSLANVQSHCM
jgi:hypothetical protein